MLSTTEELAEVVAAVSRPFGIDSTGELANAFLTLHTKFLWARLVQCPSKRAGHGPKSYDLDPGNGVTIPSNYKTFKASHDFVETSCFAFNDPRLLHGIDVLNVLVAQIASWTGKRSVRVPGRHISWNVKTPDEVRLYLLLAKPTDDVTFWIRIDLVVVTAYDSDVTVAYYPQLKTMTRGEIARALEEDGIQKSPVFQLFDEVEARAITLW